MCRLVILGAPGAGKGTHAKSLAQKGKLLHISTGALLRAEAAKGSVLGQQASQFMADGKLVPDELVLALVGASIAALEEKRFILDGFPRTIEQAVALERFLTQQGCPLTEVIHLAVSEEILLQRILQRGRADDTPEVFQERMREYNEKTTPLLDFYRRLGLLVTVDAEFPREQVFERILKLLSFP